MAGISLVTSTTPATTTSTAAPLRQTSSCWRGVWVTLYEIKKCECDLASALKVAAWIVTGLLTLGIFPALAWYFGSIEPGPRSSEPFQDSTLARPAPTTTPASTATAAHSPGPTSWVMSTPEGIAYRTELERILPSVSEGTVPFRAKVIVNLCELLVNLKRVYPHFTYNYKDLGGRCACLVIRGRTPDETRGLLEAVRSAAPPLTGSTRPDSIMVMTDHTETDAFIAIEIDGPSSFSFRKPTPERSATSSV